MRTVLATLDGQPIFLAQADLETDGTPSTTQDPNAPATDAPAGGGELFGNPMVMMIMIGLIILWIFLLGGGSKKRKQQAAMLKSLAKGDKVVSIGGIRGSIVEVREDEIVVKVDENNNTRMKFSRESISKVVDPSSSKDKDKSDKDKSKDNDKDSDRTKDVKQEK